MKKLMMIVATMATLFAMNDCFCEEPAAGAEAVKTVRKPKKLPEYKLWQQASDAATVWEQPVIVFVGVQGDKMTSKLKTMILGNQAVKELIMKNALLYSYTIPAKKASGRQKADKDAPPAADRKAIKESEKIIINKVAPEGNHGTPTFFPVVALVEPSGKVIFNYVPDPSDVSLTHFINALKEAFTQGKLSLEMTSKVEKILKEEAKKRAVAEKRKK